MTEISNLAELNTHRTESQENDAIEIGNIKAPLGSQSGKAPDVSLQIKTWACVQVGK